MNTEKTSPSFKEVETLQMKMKSAESKAIKVTGDIEDRVYDLDGNLLGVYEGHNLVVDSFLLLIAALLSNDSSYTGATYWAIGSGASSWDSSLPDPTLDETTLVNEIGRVALDSGDIVYLDSNYDESATPTNIIQITHTFGSNDCNGSWREFGIFGGDATATTDSGIMVDKKNHALITKSAEMEVVRKLRLTFQFTV